MEAISDLWHKVQVIDMLLKHCVLLRSVLPLQSKRRAELEERLAAKRKEEQEAIDARTGHERTIRNLRFDIIKKEDEKNAFTAIYKARRASKLSLANFLCTKSGNDNTTSSTGSSSANTIGSLKPAPLPELPHALPPSSTHSSSSTKPLYYLPYKLLPWQADQIDSQIEDMRNDLEKEEDDWKDELIRREAEIQELKAKRAELTGGNEESSSSSVRRRSARRDDDDDEDTRMDESSLAGRAPLPEREPYDELSGDARAASNEPPREKEDSNMTPADGDDRLECEFTFFVRILSGTIADSPPCRLITPAVPSQWITCISKDRVVLARSMGRLRNKQFKAWLSKLACVILHDDYDYL